MKNLNVVLILCLFSTLTACSNGSPESDSVSSAVIDSSTNSEVVEMKSKGSTAVKKSEISDLAYSSEPSLVLDESASEAEPIYEDTEPLLVDPDEKLQPDPQAGVVTAGEWNDLENWNFWQDVSKKVEFANYSKNWGFYTSNRVLVSLSFKGEPVVNQKVELLRNDTVIWTARTDNVGSAQLWVSLWQQEGDVDYSKLHIRVDGKLLNKDTKLKETLNKFEVNAISKKSQKVDISFIVDATGSMSDEIDFLKRDLQSVIDSVKEADANLNINTSAVFYRDEGDDYVTRTSQFSSNLNKTTDFIKKQSANGGGDFPEAVHSALDESINKLEWSDDAKTKIAFLLLDAPAHNNTEVKGSLHKSIKSASEKGIKIIPITASGIDKDTEFLMRNIAITTNGTYVFITNDSGVGNDHIEASVGKHNIENLNYLMVRLIRKYSK